MTVLNTQLNPRSADFAANAQAMRALVDDLRAQVAANQKGVDELRKMVGFEPRKDAAQMLETAGEEADEAHAKEMEQQSAMIDEGLAPDPVAESEAKVEALK